MKVRDNKYIPAEDKDFFILLRIGLWQTVTEPLSAAPDWSYIYKLACEQTVQGIVADGLAIYRSQHPDLQITQEQNDQFLSATAQIVRQNYKVNQTQLRLNALFSEAGIPFFGVKGQEAAKNYPKPMLRCSGDIEYHLRLSCIPQAQQVLAPLASHIGTYETYLQHQDYEIDGIEVELHGALHPRLGTKIDQVLDQLQADVFNEIETIETFNAVYVLIHCLQHFHWSGLGLRQITDWCMLLAKSDNINYSRIQQAISEMGIQTEFNVFLSFCIDWLGLETPLAFRRGERGEAPLWLEAKAGGNMGHHKEQKARISNTLLRVSSSWINNFRSYFRHKSISPVVSRRLLQVQFNEYKKHL